MKKRLLITSIVMMLVVAVALSTATYAWFTSNAAVSASSVTLTAASAEGLAMGIGWKGSTTGIAISSDDSSDLAPMIPMELSKTGTKTKSNVSFNGSTVYTNNGIVMFNAASESNVYAKTPYTLTESGEGTATIFYLENLSATKPIASVTLTATVTGDAASLVRIAVFTSGTTDTDTVTDYELVEVLADKNATGEALTTCVGEVSANGPILGQTGTALTTYTAAPSVTLAGIAASTKVYYKVVMWLDGDDFLDANASQTADVVLDFVAA